MSNLLLLWYFIVNSQIATEKRRSNVSCFAFTLNLSLNSTNYEIESFSQSLQYKKRDTCTLLGYIFLHTALTILLKILKWIKNYEVSNNDKLLKKTQENLYDICVRIYFYTFVHNVRKLYVNILFISVLKEWKLNFIYINVSLYNMYLITSRDR